MVKHSYILELNYLKADATIYIPYILLLLIHCSKTGSVMVMPLCGEESMRSALMRAVFSRGMLE